MDTLDRVARLRRIIDENLAVDLHSHTRHSDGAWTPTELAADGAAEGLAMQGLTDHDNIGGLAEFELAAYRRGLLPVVGCEVTITFEGRNYHMLSFDIDPAASVWSKIREGAFERRLRYFDRLFEMLRERGLNVTTDMARDETGAIVQKPTSTAMIKGGNCQTEEEAAKILKDFNLDYPIAMLAVTAEDYATWLPEGGALCSVAHAMREEPGTSNRLTDRHAEAFKSMLPLVALECYHPYHKPEEVEAALELARRHDLAITAGSDAHGYGVKRPPRPYPAEQSRRFLELLHDRWAGKLQAERGQKGAQPTHA